MSKSLYLAVEYRHDNGKMRAMAIEISRTDNLKKVFEEDVYVKNAFYIMACETRKEMNKIVEDWNNTHEKNNNLMSWDELTEVVK